jgi:AraC-like DNA-binding protein
VLAGDPTSAWRIGSLAREVGCSPYHLARLFRRATGTSIHQYLLRLRLAIALGRLAQGETDLGRLAADLGFAHHSHFSASFRRIFGLTPTQARRSLTGSGWAEMSTFLTARERHAA